MSATAEETYTAEEQREHRRELCAALRSGEYPQGRMRLRTDEGFCCLGVACDRYRESTGRGEWLPLRGEKPPHRDFSTQGDTDTAFMPREVADYYGFRNTNGSFDASVEIGGLPGPFLSLYALNDSGATFEEIADVIEAEPMGLVR